MSFILTSLPPLPHDSPSQLSKKLPELRPLFFVPPLDDRPQNPIVDALIEVSAPLYVPDECTDIVGLQEDAELSNDAEVEQDLWSVNKDRRQRQSQNISWDSLRTTFSTKATSTPFLSEQSNYAFDAVRHYVCPRLDDPSLQLRFIRPTELLDLLMINMVGNSSPLYIWDKEHEGFVSNGPREDAKLVVIIEGLDDVASDSIIRRFLKIGTLMRRLDMLVISTQGRNSNPTVHAFSHAVSTILSHIRSTLTHKPHHSAVRLISLWLHYADAEALLSALATLCSRADNDTPPYALLPESPAGLLSHIYKHLQWHIELRSLRLVTAMVAYILTTASRDYFTGIGESLGLYEPSRPPWLRTVTSSKKNHHRDSDLLQLEDEVLDPSSVSVATDDSDKSEWPDFFPSELAEALPTARKSLRILQAADPDHPLCSTSAVATCEWVWSPAEVERLWTDGEISGSGGNVSEEFTNEIKTTTATPRRDYNPELEQFEIFDLEPGAHLINSISSTKSPSPVEYFLSAFPERLPSLTPTLQHLSKIVLQPLVTRTVLLSSSLLQLYLTSLNLETHLTILRSYLLLTLPSFKTRLVEALFSDSDEYRPVGRGTRARTRARLGIAEARDILDAENDPGSRQGIGLGHGLAERDTWPPGGADLSFFLRTVIVDSLEERTNERGNEETEKVWKEAEFRMGFALRDLPVGDGRERWLNPMSIEALDFLYLDYKPPHPLDIIITPDVLSKYQRVFTFLLRLLRAETVTRIAYRSSFKSGGPVFAYAPEAQKMLVRLQFQIQTFVTSLVAYVFDFAIGSNFDAYVRRISKLREDVSDDTLAVDEFKITDIFMLEESHSDLLNHILSGCLLRTTQRSAGDGLRDLLELVLQFGVLVMDIRRGYLREAHAAEELRELDSLFQKHMLSLVKAIQILCTKGRVSDQTTNSLQLGETGLHLQTRSTFEALLTKMDPTGWWRGKLEKQGKAMT